MKPNPFPPLRVGNAGPAPRFLLLPVDPAMCYPMLTTYTGDDNGRERAEYACQAVNSHAGLVAALKALRWNIDVSNINNSKRSVKRWEELIDQADAELAKLT